MIKKIIFPLIAIILLSSCANKFSIQKRKYNKGFYIASSKSNSVKDDNVKASHLKTKTLNTIPVATEEIVKAEIKPVTNNEVILVAQKPENKKQFVAHNSNKGVTASADKTVVQPTKEFKEIVTNKVASSKMLRKGESGAKLIVMVILCFFPFINLIPVYIHDGGVTLNFWITLLLCFTVLGGIIFSLLVVLDIVDLA